MGLIKWKCDRCGEVFTGHHGFLGIKTTEIIDASRNRQAWEKEHFGWKPPMDAGMGPTPARWHALHDECIELGEEFDYWVPGEHADTPAKVLGFLCRKNMTIYIDKTDFFDFLIRQGVPDWL